MRRISSSELTERIIEEAKSLGADMAGVASIEALKTSPSHRIYPKIGMGLDARWQDVADNAKPHGTAWPEDAVTAVVIGFAHNADSTELDWWDGRGTPGNRILIRINRTLSEWIENTFAVKTYRLPYFVEKGGIFLKDAAVMAGLGCIGRNNLVITPEFGPRVRFRALLLNRAAEATGPLDFSPCEKCPQPCRDACPVNAFQDTVYSADALAQSSLPGIDGTYDRVVCNTKMQQDIEDAVSAVPAKVGEHQAIRQAVNAFEDSTAGTPELNKETNLCVKYCRRCELSCPVGKHDGDGQ